MSEEIVIEVCDLKKYFPIKIGFFRTLLAKQVPHVHAVEGVSFKIARGKIFGLVGESGCGKTTTGRMLLRLVEPTSGKVFFKGEDISTFSTRKMQKLRTRIQMVFQDPYESLNPRMSIFDTISEPLCIHGHYDGEELSKRVENKLFEMGLVPPEEFVFRFPHEISGGQRQRVAIARSFITDPEFIVADEPLSMLDASIRTEISELMLNLVNHTHVSMLYITHDVALARYMCDRIGVMYLGEIVEMGDVDLLVGNPLHPYTVALMAAVPVPDPNARRIDVIIKGEIPSSVNPPSGCRFHTRCPQAMEICRREKPQLIEVEENRYVACHLVQKR